MRRKERRGYFFVLTLLLSLLLIVLAFYLQKQLSSFQSLGLFGIFLINLVGNATVFLPAPAFVSVVAGGFVYPPLAVAVVSGFGGAIGDMVGFLFGISGKKLFIKNHHKLYILFKDLFHKFGGIVIFVAALVPNPFFDVIGIVGGVFFYPPVKFFLLLFAGRLIRNLLLAYAGSVFSSF